MPIDPSIDLDDVEDHEDCEAPRDSIYDDALACRGELIDDGPKEEQVDQRPVFKDNHQTGENETKECVYQMR